MSTTAIQLHRDTKDYGAVIDVCEYVAAKTDRSTANALVWMLRGSQEYQDALAEMTGWTPDKEPIVPPGAGESPERAPESQ